MEFYHLYPSEFQDLLQHDYGKESYIGQGNPASKILIIGKECTDADYAFINNAEIWKKKTPENIVNWFTGQSWNYYHPRHPFYGQLFLKDNNSKKNPKHGKNLIEGLLLLGRHTRNLSICYYHKNFKLSQGNYLIFMSTVF